MVDVFISYSRSGRAKAESIKAKLEGLGLDCYFDLERIDGGVNFPDRIDRALRVSKSVLCCWSPRYFERPWCMIECRDAMAREIMIPVAVEPFERFAPPADLRLINWFDLADWGGEDTHEGWARTLSGLGKLVGRALAPCPKPASVERVGDVAVSAGLETIPSLLLGAPQATQTPQEMGLKPDAVWRDAIPGMPADACPEMLTLQSSGDPAFGVSINPVTFAEWDAAIAVGAKLSRPSDQGWGRDRQPVINVSWDDAQAYIGWLNTRLRLTDCADAYRLPNDAEWAFVEQALPHHGNLWAWCADIWNDSDSQRTQHLIRGGAPNHDAAVRRGFNAAEGSCEIGFRIARTVLPKDGGISDPA